MCIYIYTYQHMKRIGFAIPIDALCVKLKLRSNIDIRLNYKLDKISQGALLYTPHGIRQMCPINVLEHFEIHKNNTSERVLGMSWVFCGKIKYLVLGLRGTSENHEIMKIRGLRVLPSANQKVLRPKWTRISPWSF